ncbi:MAG: efflux RND transporter permease subunit, partial [Rhodospirillaceae bacterium]
GNVAEARILLPQGTPLPRTRAVVDDVMAAARVVGHDGIIRHATVSFGQNRDAFETGAHVATVTVDLIDGDDRDVTLDEFLDAWRDRVGLLPDVISIKFAEREMGPAGRDIDIRLHGRDLDRVKAASEELQAWLNGYAGVRDLSDDLRPGKPELRLRLKDGAAGLGFTAESIASQVSAAFQGVTVDEFQIGGQTVEIDVRLVDDARGSLGDIDDFVVAPAAGGGALVPLSVVAEVAQDRGWARIQRIDGRRTVSVQGVVAAPGNAAEIISHTGTAFLPQLRERYPDLTISLEGAARETAKTGASVRRNLILGLVGIYLLLAFQFRSFVEPAAVMVAIPMSIVGAFWAHFLMGMDLSMPSIVGLAALTGVVVNDSILLVIFVKERVHAGQKAALAAPLAARERFRAIILTSLTTVGGLVPLLLETSLQAQLLIPLATSLAFGLTSATILSLFLVPAVYAILDDLGLSEYKSARRTREVDGHPKAPPPGRVRPTKDLNIRTPEGIEIP